MSLKQHVSSLVPWISPTGEIEFASDQAEPFSSNMHQAAIVYNDKKGELCFDPWHCKYEGRDFLGDMNFRNWTGAFPKAIAKTEIWLENLRISKTGGRVLRLVCKAFPRALDSHSRIDFAELLFTIPSWNLLVEKDHRGRSVKSVCLPTVTQDIVAELVLLSKKLSLKHGDKKYEINAFIHKNKIYTPACLPPSKSKILALRDFKSHEATASGWFVDHLPPQIPFRLKRTGNTATTTTDR